MYRIFNVSGTTTILGWRQRISQATSLPSFSFRFSTRKSRKSFDLPSSSFSLIRHAVCHGTCNIWHISLLADLKVLFTLLLVFLTGLILGHRKSASGAVQLLFHWYSYIEGGSVIRYFLTIPDKMHKPKSASLHFYSTYLLQ